VDAVVGVKDIAKNDEVTSHVWNEDSKYIVSCTRTGKLIISNIMKSEVS